MTPLTPFPASADVTLRPGTIVGDKYQIQGFLGAGGMGVVLQATHLELGAPVAIKIVRDELASNETVVSRFMFEARAAAQMRSSHIVRVLDVARLPSGVPYMVMEYLQGDDLAALLAQRGVIPVREAASYVLQACEGLAEAHSLGIIHRDLKPENLFLAKTPEGVVLKILDFGISKDVRSPMRQSKRSTLSNGGTAVGSPYYMSPEQMRASPNLDARADIWSLGTILYELVTGRCPFEGESLALLCSKVMVEDAPSLLKSSNQELHALDPVIQRALKKEPAERFQSVTELSDALRAAVAVEQLGSKERQYSESGINLKVGHPGSSATQEFARAVRPFAGRRGLFGLTLVGALLSMVALGYWQRAPLNEKLRPYRVQIAELIGPVAPGDARQTAMGKPLPPVPSFAPVIPAAVPELRSQSDIVVSPGAAPPPVPSAAAPVQKPAPSPPAWRPAPRPLALPNGPGARYGL